MKRKFVQQKDEMSCGPVAIINAKKWLGDIHPTIYILRKRCKTKLGYGSSVQHMSKVINDEFEFNLTKRRTNNPRLIKDALEEGHGIILRYKTGKEGHYVFMFKEDNQIYITNDSIEERTIEKLCAKQLETYLEPETKYIGGYHIKHPVAWIINCRKLILIC